jgi:cation/acetate symporter
VLAATLAAASGTALALASTIGQDLVPGLLGRGAPGSRRIAAVRLVMIAAVGGASYAALRLPVDVPTLAQWSFSLAAAGLFPALVLGIWWKRANAWGATLGMLAGFSLCLAYLAGSHFFPVELHGLTGQYSTASDIALRRMESLDAAWSGAEGEARAAARAALEDYARGGPTSPGVANLFGILPVASGAIGLLVGFLVIFVVSLITPRPWAETTLLVDEMRRPSGAPILDGD